MPKSKNPAAIVKYHHANRRDRRRFRILMFQLWPLAACSALNLQLYDSRRILLLRESGGPVILWSSFQLACAFGAGEMARVANVFIASRSGRFEGKMRSTRC